MSRETRCISPISLYCPINKQNLTTNKAHHNKNTAPKQNIGQCSKAAAEDSYMMEIGNEITHSYISFLPVTR